MNQIKLFSVVLVLAVVGCGGSGSDSNGSGNPDIEPESVSLRLKTESVDEDGNGQYDLIRNYSYDEIGFLTSVAHIRIEDAFEPENANKLFDIEAVTSEYDFDSDENLQQLIMTFEFGEEARAELDRYILQTSYEFTYGDNGELLTEESLSTYSSGNPARQRSIFTYEEDRLVQVDKLYATGENPLVKNQEIQYEYNVDGQPIKITKLNHTFYLIYDEQGYLTEQSIFDTEDGSSLGSINYEYHMSGEVKRYSDEGLFSRDYEVDVTFNAEGVPIEINYSEDGQEVSVSDLVYEPGPCKNIVRFYEYDSGSVTPFNQPNNYVKPGLGFSVSESYAPNCVDL